MIEKSQPTGGKVNEKSHVTAVTRTSKSPFEASTGQKTQYYVGVLKDKRTGKNGLAFLIGWRDYPDSKYDTWEPITNLPGSENMIVEFNIK